MATNHTKIQVEKNKFTLIDATATDREPLAELYDLEAGVPVINENLATSANDINRAMTDLFDELPSDVTYAQQSNYGNPKYLKGRKLKAFDTFEPLMSDFNDFFNTTSNDDPRSRNDNNFFAMRPTTTLVDKRFFQTRSEKQYGYAIDEELFAEELVRLRIVRTTDNQSSQWDSFCSHLTNLNFIRQMLRSVFKQERVQKQYHRIPALLLRDSIYSECKGSAESAHDDVCERLATFYQYWLNSLGLVDRAKDFFKLKKEGQHTVPVEVLEDIALKQFYQITLKEITTELDISYLQKQLNINRNLIAEKLFELGILFVRKLRIADRQKNYIKMALNIAKLCFNEIDQSKMPDEVVGHSFVMMSKDNYSIIKMMENLSDTSLTLDTNVMLKALDVAVTALADPRVGTISLSHYAGMIGTQKILSKDEELFAPIGMYMWSRFSEVRDYKAIDFYRPVVNRLASQGTSIAQLEQREDWTQFVKSMDTMPSLEADQLAVRFISQLADVLPSSVLASTSKYIFMNVPEPILIEYAAILMSDQVYMYAPELLGTYDVSKGPITTGETINIDASPRFNISLVYKITPMARKYETPEVSYIREMWTQDPRVVLYHSDDLKPTQDLEILPPNIFKLDEDAFYVGEGMDPIMFDRLDKSLASTVILQDSVSGNKSSVDQVIRSNLQELRYQNTELDVYFSRQYGPDRQFLNDLHMIYAITSRAFLHWFLTVLDLNASSKKQVKRPESAVHIEAAWSFNVEHVVRDLLKKIYSSSTSFSQNSIVLSLARKLVIEGNLAHDLRRKKISESNLVALRFFVAVLAIVTLRNVPPRLLTGVYMFAAKYQNGLMLQDILYHEKT
jgi:hypothetical protein